MKEKKNKRSHPSLYMIIIDSIRAIIFNATSIATKLLGHEKIRYEDNIAQSAVEVLHSCTHQFMRLLA